MFTQGLKSASQLSSAIRAKKKKIAEAPPEIIDTSPTPDMNAQDVWDLEKRAQIQDTVGSPEKINADQTAMDEPYDQAPMSKEPMASKENPKDHGMMAYGGMAKEHADPMLPSEAMGAEEAGSAGENSEMHRRVGGGPSVGEGVEGEEKRRVGRRKQRLSSYLDSLDNY